jgi:hypothetical protein
MIKLDDYAKKYKHVRRNGATVFCSARTEEKPFFTNP